MHNPRRLFLHQLGREFGIIDIDHLDNCITDEQLLEFQAAAWLHGWDHGRRQPATIAAEIRNHLNVTMAMNTSDFKKTIQDMEFHDSNSVIKSLTKVDKEKSKTAMTPDQYLKRLGG